MVVAGFLAAGIALLLSRLAQNLWESPRPIYDPAFEGLFQHKFLSLVDEDYHSFPSDHAAFILPLVWAVARLQRALGILTSVLLAGTLFARLYTGVHFPGDLLGGLAVGATAVLLMHLWPEAPGCVLALVEAAQARWSVATAAVLFFIAYSYASMFEPARDLTLGVFRAFWHWCCGAS
jgi:undecaprenyl-diphosphatase